MTYIELLNRFWDFYRVKKFSDIDTTIYFYLLNECNIRRWLNPFELQTRNLEVSLQISRKTIGEARNRLKQRGVIDFIEASGRGPTTYLINGADVTNELLNDPFCVSPKKHEGNTNGNTKVTQGKHKGNTMPDSTLYNEEIRYNKTKDIDGAKSPDVGKSLFEEEEKKARRRKKTPLPKPTDPPPPTIEDIKAYFLTQNANVRLADWEREAEVFYNHFSSLGWKTSAGAKIARWDSRANLWIMEHEHKPQKSPNNEPGQNDKFSGRRGTEPDTKSRKGFKGAF